MTSNITAYWVGGATTSGLIAFWQVFIPWPLWCFIALFLFQLCVLCYLVAGEHD